MNTSSIRSSVTSLPSKLAKQNIRARPARYELPDLREAPAPNDTVPRKARKSAPFVADASAKSRRLVQLFMLTAN
jgi:hypothetical protein